MTGSFAQIMKTADPTDKGSALADSSAGNAADVLASGNWDRERVASAVMSRPQRTRLTSASATAHTRWITWPPSTGITAPVMNEENGLSRNVTQRATSSATPIRPSGTCSASHR